MWILLGAVVAAGLVVWAACLWWRDACCLLERGCGGQSVLAEARRRVVAVEIAGRRAMAIEGEDERKVVECDLWEHTKGLWRARPDEMTLQDAVEIMALTAERSGLHRQGLLGSFWLAEAEKVKARGEAMAADNAGEMD